MNFPTRKSDILQLADRMIAGLSENPKTFPEPPFTTQKLSALRQEVQQAGQNRQAAKALLRQAVREQDECITALKKLMQQIHRSQNDYQPELPEHFQKLVAAVHANPQTIPVMYLRRFGILL
jgi:hypothetical protein